MSAAQNILNLYSDLIDKKMKPVVRASNCPQWFTDHLSQSFNEAKANVLAGMAKKLDDIFNKIEFTNHSK